MSSIIIKLMQVRQRLELAALAAKREPEDITLLAVSKTFPTSAIEEAMHAGQSAFGENYVQEGVEKIQQLDDIRPCCDFSLSAASCIRICGPLDDRSAVATVRSRV